MTTSIDTPKMEIAALAAQYNPFVSPQLENPFPIHALARRTAPVFHSRILDRWVVSRHVDVCAVMRARETFLSGAVLPLCSECVSEVARIFEEENYARMPLTLDNDDPVSHTRIRSSVLRGFTQQRMAAFAPAVRAIANQLIDGFVAGGEADLVTQFAIPFTFLANMQFIGVPREDMAMLKRWHEDYAAYLGAILPEEELVACARGLVAYKRYCAHLVAEKKRSPQDDLLSGLVSLQAEDGSKTLSDAELAHLINDLLFGGESTIYGIGGGVKTLLSVPERWLLLRNRPELLPAIVEETLRIDTPVPSLLRTAAREVEVGGISLPAGAQLFLSLSSANQDEDVFPDPGRFDPERPNLEQHVSFGRSAHHCLGASLARLEMRVAFDVLSKRLPGLRLVPGQEFQYLPNCAIRALTRLDVAWDRPTRA